MDTRKVTLVATIAVIALVAVGVGFAYSAMTNNSGNNSELKYLLMVPTNEAGADTYQDSFDDAKITYSNETHKVTAAEAEAETYHYKNSGLPCAAGDEIVIFNLDTVFGTGLPGGGAIKAGEIYLQIDEKNNVETDQYYIKIFGNEGSVLMDTDDFYFLVGFQVDQDLADDEDAPVTNIDESTIFFDGEGDPILPTGEELKPYVKGSGAVSNAITSVGTGFTIVKVTLWITGATGALPAQVLSLAEAYTGTGLTEPMTDVTLTFKAIKPDNVVTGITAATSKASIDLSENETATLSATIAPVGADIPNVKWVIVSGGDKVSVDQNGVVKPVATGEATIKAVSLDGTNVNSNTVTITVVE